MTRKFNQTKNYLCECRFLSKLIRMCSHSSTSYDGWLDGWSFAIFKYSIHKIVYSVVGTSLSWQKLLMAQVPLTALNQLLLSLDMCLPTTRIFVDGGIKLPIKQSKKLFHRTLFCELK